MRDDYLGLLMWVAEAVLVEVWKSVVDLESLKKKAEKTRMQQAECAL
jgi:hypothetical protein